MKSPAENLISQGLPVLIQRLVSRRYRRELSRWLCR